MKQTYGQKFTSQAEESYPSVMVELREFAKFLTGQAMEALDVFSKNHGLDYVLLKMDNLDNFSTIFSHRDAFVGKCLELLHIDIGCSIVASDSVMNRFVLRIGAVKPYEGGQVQYDFPVWANGEMHNLEHLRGLELDGDDLVLFQAFEILVGRGFENLHDKKRAMEWGLEHPSVIVNLTDRRGFFDQFEGRIYGDNPEVRVDPFVRPQ